MLDATGFINCITDSLKAAGFGKKRIAEVIDRFEGLAAGYKFDGYNDGDAYLLAMDRSVSELSVEKAEAAKRRLKSLQTYAAHAERVEQGVDGVTTSPLVWDRSGQSGGVAVARGAISLIEDDPRFRGTNYNGNKESVRGALYQLLGDQLNTFGKGAYGRQLGKAHLPNIVRELYGQATGDANAKQMAQAWEKTNNVAVDMFNAAGGSMAKLKSYRLPQGQNAARLIKVGYDKWAQMHMDALDWNAMRWPNGAPIAPSDRENILKYVFETISTNGASSLSLKNLRGQGRAIGNQLEKHRFLVYKDAESWLQVHDTFSDGNVFDVMVHHLDDMAHKIAAVQTFGPNPDMAAHNLHGIVRNKASKLGGKAVAEAEAEMKNVFDPMFETVMRENPMDPHSNMGALVTGTGNLLTAAQLGSASFLAIPGDFMQTAAVRMLNRMNPFAGVDYYIKSIATDMPFQRQIAAQSGFVMDETVMAVYGAQRFTGVATIGPAWTRRVSDATMRASLLSPHTRAARWATQAEFMGLMSRNKGQKFDTLPWKAVAERYGITEQDWDTFRKNVKPWQPRKDVNFLRPIDLLQSNVKDSGELYRKFQNMVFEESRKMVPESGIEAAVRLRDTTRPDTLIGAILYSFAMYKNFPVAFQMLYGRLGLSNDSVRTRIGFYAGLGAGMTMVGALGTQLREMSKGRDPLPMDTPAFYGKAFLAGGALSIWGDFLFTGINEYGRNPAELIGGPITGFIGDTTQLAFGDVFKWADTVGSLDAGKFKSSTAPKAVQWVKRYTPGTSIWWARLALERQVFDRLEEMADPMVYQKRARRRQRQRREFGNDSWWAQGDRAPQRAPSFEGVTR